jgi:hypothetical protein
VFREAHHQGMTGANYLWLGVDAWMANRIFDNIEDPADKALLQEAIAGSIGLLPNIMGPNLQPYIDDVWNPKYCKQYDGTYIADEVLYATNHVAHVGDLF